MKQDKAARVGLYRYTQARCTGWASAWGRLRRPETAAVPPRWAAPTQSPAPDCPSVSREGPEGSPGNTPKPAAVLAAPAGACVHTCNGPAKGLSEEIHQRPLASRDPHQRGPGNYSPGHSGGPWLTWERTWEQSSLRLLVAVELFPGA